MAFSDSLNDALSSSKLSLSTDAAAFLKLLAFFSPTPIDKVMVAPSRMWSPAGELKFMNKSELARFAEQELFDAGLAELRQEQEALIIPSIVCDATMKAMIKPEQSFFLDAAHRILHNSVGDSFKRVTEHQHKKWERYQRNMRHFENVVENQEKYSINIRDKQSWAETILQFAWYHYESEDLDTAELLVDKSLHLEVGPLTRASTWNLLGFIELDRNNAPNALSLFSTALEIRQTRYPDNHDFIASSYNAMSLAYTELGDFFRAVEFGRKAIGIRRKNILSRKNDIEMQGNSLSNMASTLLRMGHPYEAEETLSRCPSHQKPGLTKMLETGNPRFAGDALLLARIKRAQVVHDRSMRWPEELSRYRQNYAGQTHQGLVRQEQETVEMLRAEQAKLDGAIKLSIEGHELRMKTFGAGRRTADSAYVLATLFIAKDDLESARLWLEKSFGLAVEKGLGATYGARAVFELSRVRVGSGEEVVRECEAAAKAMLVPKEGETVPENPGRVYYEGLVPWFLW